MVVDIGVADLRHRLREVLTRVEAGEEVMVTRRGQVVAVLRRPQRDETPDAARWLEDWRAEHDVAVWNDDDPWAGVRDSSPGPRPVAW